MRRTVSADGVTRGSLFQRIRSRRLSPSDGHFYRARFISFCSEWFIAAIRQVSAGDLIGFCIQNVAPRSLQQCHQYRTVGTCASQGRAHLEDGAHVHESVPASTSSQVPAFFMLRLISYLSLKILRLEEFQRSLYIQNNLRYKARARFRTTCPPRSPVAGYGIV